MGSHHEPSVIGSRRGLNILPIQTNINSPNARPKRPPRPDDPPDREASGDRAPVKPQSSKSSLKSLFSRNKASRRSNHEQTLPAIAESHRMIGGISIIPDPISSPTSVPATPITPKNPAVIASHLSDRTGSNDSSMTSLKSSNEKGQKIYRTITAWDPPPLFQAYPQAIKQGHLPAVSLSAESILRINGHRRHGSKDDFSDIDADDERTLSASARKRKEEKEKKHLRRVSGSINKAEWSQKIFILVSSGYLLQYAGEGSFDRLPEKMLELGKNSVAFASDAIPGRHWVVQVSQTLDEQGSQALDTKKTFFSRFGFADSRKQTKSLLLICSNPDEMTSWLSAVRKEIEALGGKEYVPETPLEESSQTSQQNQTQWTDRQSTMSGVNQHLPMHLADTCPAESSPNLSTLNTTEEQKSLGSKPTDESSLKSANRRSTPRRQSIEAPSLSTTGTFTDLDRLREGSRLSYVSIGTRTIPSSRGSSPGLSPARLNGTASKPPYTESPRSIRSSTADLGSKRLSIHTYSSVQPEDSSTDTTSGSRPESVVAPLAARSASPPNFSVPIFSKRFSGSHSGHPSASRKLHQASPPPSPRILNPSAFNRLSGLDDFVPHSQPSDNQPVYSEPDKKPHLYQQSAPFIFDPEIPSRTAAIPKPRETRARRYSSFESTRGTYGSSSNYQPRLSPVGNESSEEGSNNDVISHHDRPPKHKEVDYISAKADIQDRQLRRPVSMQIGSEARRRTEDIHPPQTHKNFPSPDMRPTYRRTRASLAHPEMVRDSSPAGHHPSKSSNRTSLHKSMSNLSLGPPVSPPPNCPLPDVPPNVVSQYRTSWKDPIGLASGHVTRRPRSRTGPEECGKSRTAVPPVDLRDAENSPRLSGMTPKEYSMVNAF
ncbi:hypothetical protein AJ79_04041 [Helicocarpus griseus UAMH5409]|uniref:PH domain-containing protein n=1 Tax=Helicocarpus griseus UAMH5409 TaxID=1447875 RepID=A0A2B7XWD4_9EURO|nr:hypothetical protein AJ79_04041 [Helicocarpus griseus UAMH5409]